MYSEIKKLAKITIKLPVIFVMLLALQKVFDFPAGLSRIFLLVYLGLAILFMVFFTLIIFYYLNDLIDPKPKKKKHKKHKK